MIILKGARMTSVYSPLSKTFNGATPVTACLALPANLGKKPMTCQDPFSLSYDWSKVSGDYDADLRRGGQ